MSVVVPFAGFRPEAIQFLADLAQNNDRAWFQPRKATYVELLKEPLEALCVALDDELRRRGLPLRADPARSPFRIYRDTRFSRDKSPYKTHVAASFGWTPDRAPDRAPDRTPDRAPDADRPESGAGRSHTESVHASGGYFHLAPGDIFVGGGVWHPETAWLNAFRRRVAADPAAFRAIVDAPAFRDAFGTVGDEGESLRRVPAGYPPDHPAADLLRLKNVTFGRRLADSDAMSPELPVILAEAFDLGTPLLRYLATVA